MPSESQLVTIRDNLLTTLNGMSQAEGYWYDYQPAQEGVADLDAEVEHQPVVDSEQACICLVATEHPARFKGWISRLLQPLVGM